MKWHDWLKSLVGLHSSDVAIVERLLKLYPVTCTSNNSSLSNADSNEPEPDKHQVQSTERLYDIDLNDHQILVAGILLINQKHLLAGNTCLRLSSIANRRFFFSEPDENPNTQIDEYPVISEVTSDTSVEKVESISEEKSGILMPPVEKLTSILNEWLSTQVHPAPFSLQGESLVVDRYRQFEVEIFKRMQALTQLQPLAFSNTTASIFQTLFESSSRGSSSNSVSAESVDWQAVAALTALNYPLCILNGGPGTGKTYTVTRMLILLLSTFPNAKVQLTAPTGKAAQRLNESIQKNIKELAEHEHLQEFISKVPLNAITIHRLLGTHRGSASAARNESRKLSADIFVIDEFSMVDSAMFAKFLRACKSTARIILVGDAGQLASVEAGNLLSDFSLLESLPKRTEYTEFLSKHIGTANIKAFKTANAQYYSDHIVTLKTNRRSKSNINQLASAIQSGQTSVFISLLTSRQADSSENGLLETSEEQYQKLIVEKVKSLYQSYKSLINNAQNPTELLNALHYQRLLCPIRKGPYGVVNLNKLICEYLSGSTKFHGQAIIITENDPATGLSNGDIGVLWNTSEGLVAFIEREQEKPLALSIHRLPNYESAFALTIHKTQGSEYDNVCVVMPFDTTQGSSRELLYTGVTRAKESVAIIGRESVLKETISNTNQRETYLRELIKAEFSEFNL